MILLFFLFVSGKEDVWDLFYYGNSRFKPYEFLYRDIYKLSKVYHDEKSIKIHAFDCHKNYKICQKRGIRGVPTIILKNDKGKQYLFQGSKDLDSFVDFIVNVTKIEEPDFTRIELITPEIRQQMDDAGICYVTANIHQENGEKFRRVASKNINENIRFFSGSKLIVIDSHDVADYHAKYHFRGEEGYINLSYPANEILDNIEDVCMNESSGLDNAVVIGAATRTKNIKLPNYLKKFDYNFVIKYIQENYIQNNMNIKYQLHKLRNKLANESGDDKKETMTKIQCLLTISNYQKSQQFLFHF